MEPQEAYSYIERKQNQWEHGYRLQREISIKKPSKGEWKRLV
jgi:hypothetical protein